MACKAVIAWRHSERPLAFGDDFRHLLSPAWRVLLRLFGLNRRLREDHIVAFAVRARAQPVTTARPMRRTGERGSRRRRHVAGALGHRSWRVAQLGRSQLKNCFAR
jgi:hypothetical protein